MKWKEFYEKVDGWAASTAVRRISSLEDMGTPEEILVAISAITLDGEKGATRLLNRAVQSGVKFSGAELAEICCLCTEEGFLNALKASEDQLTEQDLEALCMSVEDETIVELALKYHLKAPKYIAEEYEEQLVPAITPICWNRFYDKFFEWSSKYAKARSSALTNFGSGE